MALTRDWTTVTDGTLIQLVQAGSPDESADAFGVLFDRTNGHLEGFLARRLGATSAEIARVAEETWEVALESLNTYEDRGKPFLAWLCGIAKKLWLTRMRELRRHPPLPEGFEVAAVDAWSRDPLMQLAERDDQHDLAAALREAIAALKPDQRAVLERRLVLGKSSREVADELGFTVTKVDTALHRARRVPHLPSGAIRAPACNPLSLAAHTRSVRPVRSCAEQIERANSMTSLEEERARILAAYTDDLLADRDPSISPEATALFSPEELAQVLSTARFLKGLLRPSQVDPGVEAGLRARLVERARATRAAEIAKADLVPSLSALLDQRRRAAGLSPEAVAATARVSEDEFGRLERGDVPFTAVPAERLLDIAALLAIPTRQLLVALEREAERWLPRLTRRAMQAGMAGFREVGGMAEARNRDMAHREAAEELADYLARLEGLARDRGQI